MSDELVRIPTEIVETLIAVWMREPACRLDQSIERYAPVLRQHSALRLSRGVHMRTQFGAYYLFDSCRGVVLCGVDDLERYGRALRALQPFEQLEE